MPSKHYVVVVPGLGDEQRIPAYLLKQWKKFGVTPYLHLVPWKKQEVFSTKLERLIQVVDKFSKKGVVSLVGISAGASMVLNAYMQRKKQISAVVNICGRLKAGEKTLRPLDATCKGNRAFREAVLFCEEKEKLLSRSEKRKILNMRAMYDVIVPPSTSVLDGAKNMRLPVIEHNTAIVLALSMYKKRIIDFLHQQAPKN